MPQESWHYHEEKHCWSVRTHSSLISVPPHQWTLLQRKRKYQHISQAYFTNILKGWHFYNSTTLTILILTPSHIPFLDADHPAAIPLSNGAPHNPGGFVTETWRLWHADLSEEKNGWVTTEFALLYPGEVLCSNVVLYYTMCICMVEGVMNSRFGWTFVDGVLPESRKNSKDMHTRFRRQS